MFTFPNKFPKSVLHEFYQQHSTAGIPVFSIESGPRPPALPSFTCTLTIPGVQTPLGGFEEATFTAWSRSKKSAEHAAAEKALAFLVSKGLLKAPHPTNALDVNARVPKVGDTDIKEVNFTQERLRALCSQAYSGNKPAIATIADASGAEFESAEVDLDGLSKEELLLELKKARQVNERLKAELSLEQQRRMAVLTALIQAN